MCPVIDLVVLLGVSIRKYKFALNTQMFIITAIGN